MNHHRDSPTLTSRGRQRLLPPSAAALGLLCAVALALAGAAPLLAGNGRWTPIGPPGGGPIRALVAAGGVVYVSTGEGVLASKDGGRHWRPADAGLDLAGGGPVLLTVDPRRSSLLYASNGQHVYRSFDGAASWQALDVPAAGFNQVVIAPSRPRTLYVTSCLDASPGNCAIETSADRGRTWAVTSIPFVELGQLVVDPADPGTLYLATERIAKSTDGGASWSIVGPGDQQLQFPGALAVDPAAPDTVYAAGAAAVGKSADAGRSWEISTAGLPQPVGGVILNVDLSALIVDPKRPSVLYTAAAGADGNGIGVFTSRDAGATWAHLSRGLPRAHLDGRLAFDPATGVLYASTFDLGIYAFKPTLTPDDPAAGPATGTPGSP